MDHPGVGYYRNEGAERTHTGQFQESHDDEEDEDKYELALFTTLKKIEYKG
ncbi:hypothetical protein AGMMS49928_14060 [Spirochaetia bacterium]|nr:hypothetical protein AGMMS49928_14060 [Spirochaetia bacterium]